MLSGSTGNLLEDETTIGIITEAKQVGSDIAKKQVRAQGRSYPPQTCMLGHVIHMILTAIKLSSSRTNKFS